MHFWASRCPSTKCLGRRSKCNPFNIFSVDTLWAPDCFSQNVPIDPSTVDASVLCHGHSWRILRPAFAKATFNVEGWYAPCLFLQDVSLWRLVDDGNDCPIGESGDHQCGGLQSLSSTTCQHLQAYQHPREHILIQTSLDVSDLSEKAYAAGAKHRYEPRALSPPTHINRCGGSVSRLKSYRVSGLPGYSPAMPHLPC